MKPFRSFTTTAKAGLAAAFVLAGLTSTLSVAAAAAVPTPAVDITCPIHGNRFTTYYDNCQVWADHSCTLGAQGPIGPPDFVSNGCGYDVILYSNSNETGNQLCLKPFAQTHRLSSYWRSYRVIAGFNC